MAYQKQIWEDLPSTNTPITSSRLNHIEDGIYNASIPESQITNSSSESTTLGYSANYANNNLKSKMVELYNNTTGSRSIEVSSDYDFYFVRAGASPTESMIITIIDSNQAIYKYTSQQDEAYSLTFSITHDLTNNYINFTRKGSSGWDTSVGSIFKIYGIKL